MRDPKGITIEVSPDEDEVTALYDSTEYLHGVLTTDVEGYWPDSDIKEAISEMNDVDQNLITVERL